MIHARRNKDDRRIGAVFNSFICVDINFIHFSCSDRPTQLLFIRWNERFLKE